MVTMEQSKITFVCLMMLAFVSGDSLPPPCNSPIYCHGELLHTIQMAPVRTDSKTFVDMKMKLSPNETLQSFENLMKRTLRKPSVRELEKFVEEIFEPEGSEFEDWEPADWIPKPTFLENIKDPKLRNWGEDLHKLWKILGRKMKDDVKINPQQYSIIYVPHPVIVPGGRFREFYYWDSYWIVRGLLLSEMYDTVRGMLENFLSIVMDYGFIPNGGRIYYAMRSQPPMLIPMIKSYLDKTNNLEFLRTNINTMEKEFQYWLVNHTVEIEKEGKMYKLARYKDYSSGPRPESYKEDYESAQVFHTDKEKEDYYSELKAAAESGWDFSSRWFILNATNKGNLTNLKSRYIVPVDLNSIIYWNANILSEFYGKLSMSDKSLEYSNIAKEWLEAVTKVLWHEEVGVWLDYDILNEVKRDYFYPTNIAPLWTGCYDVIKGDGSKMWKILKYLEKTKIMNNLGGIPTTLEHSGEQWDYPNAWPPLQYIMIVGLDLSGDTYAKELAFQITERWVRSNFRAYEETNAMYEKYDATIPGGHGSGGEYTLQVGFGWTNGVIMELLDSYGDRLRANDEFVEGLVASIGATPVVVSTLGQVLTLILAVVLPLIVGCIGMVVYKRRSHVSNSSKRKFPKLLGGYVELKDLTFD